MTENIIKLVGLNQSPNVIFYSLKNPRNPIRYICPEWILVDERRIWTVHGLQGVFQFHKDGSISVEQEPEGGVLRYRVEMYPSTEEIEVSFTIINQSEHPFVKGCVGVCVDFRQAPDFYGLDLDRGVVHLQDRGLLSIEKTDRRFSRTSNMLTYYLAGQPLPEERTAPYGWGVSDDQPDAPFIALGSKEKEWVLATAFETAKTLNYNVWAPHHGCMHSNPSFGPVPPQGKVVLRGKIYLFQGRAEEAWRRFQKDFQ